MLVAALFHIGEQTIQFGINLLGYRFEVLWVRLKFQMVSVYHE